MPRQFEEHMLSAYLDNELSADEHALVEQRLAEDASTRELLEDLKRVRGLVGALPKWHGNDFRFDASQLGEIESVDGPERFASVARVAEDSQSALYVQELPSRSTTLSEGIESEASQASLARPGDLPPQVAESQRGFPWRTMLSLAAGVIVMILAGPYLWKSARDMAWVDQPMTSSPLGEVASPPAVAAPLDDAEQTRRDSLEWKEEQAALEAGARVRRESEAIGSEFPEPKSDADKKVAPFDASLDTLAKNGGYLPGEKLKASSPGGINARGTTEPARPMKAEGADPSVGLLTQNDALRGEVAAGVGGAASSGKSLAMPLQPMPAPARADVPPPVPVPTPASPAAASPAAASPAAEAPVPEALALNPSTSKPAGPGAIESRPGPSPMDRATWLPTRAVHPLLEQPAERCQRNRAKRR